MTDIRNKWSIKRTVRPSQNIVSTVLAKLQIHQMSNDENALIEQNVRAACDRFERLTGRAFVPATYRLNLPRFPLYDGAIRLPHPPTIRVQSISYVDGDGATQTLSASLYRVLTDHEPCVVVPVYGESWPETRDTLDAVTVTYDAGYGSVVDNAVVADFEAMPDSIKQGVLMLVAHYYDNRAAVNTTISTELDEAVLAIAAQNMTPEVVVLEN